MANLIRYGSYTPEAADKEIKSLGGNEFLKLEPGKTRIRILPPAEGETSPFRIVAQHAVEVPGQQWPVRFQCPGRGCPACLESQRLSRTGNPKDRDRAYQLSPKQKIFCCVVKRSEEERGPLVWEFGKKIHEQLVKLRRNEDAGGDFCDPYNGFDIIIEREGTGKTDTTYTVFPARQASPLHADEEQAADWCENRPELDRYTRLMTIPEVQMLLGGGAEDEYQEPRRQLPARSAAPAPRIEAAPRRRNAADDLDDLE